MDYPMVEIIWTDAHIDPASVGYSEVGVDAFGSLIELHDIGYLVRKTKKELVLAVSRCPSDNSVTSANTIPTGWVRDIIYLEPRKEPSHDSGQSGQPTP